MKKTFTQIMAFVLALTLCFSLLPMTTITAFAAEESTEEVTIRNTWFTPPTKLEYQLGEKFDPTGAELEVQFSDKSRQVFDYTHMTWDEPDMTKLGEQTIKFYVKEGSVDYTSRNITITITEDAVLSSITVSKMPKVEYTVGETFDSTGMEITATYSDGTAKVLTSGFAVDAPALDTVGTKTVTIQYGGCSTSIQITVKDTSPVVDRISVTPPTKVKYVQGEVFSTEGMVVTAYYENGTSAVVTDYEITEPDMNKVGTQAVTVSYQGKTYAFDITIEQYVEPVVLSEIKIKAPTKTTYQQGDTFSTEGMIVTAVYSNNYQEDVTNYTVSEPDMSKLGEQTVTVTYEGCSASFTITITKKEEVAPKLAKIEVTPPTKLTYTKGEKFDTTGMVVTAYYDDNTSKVISNEYKYTMTEPDMNLVGVQVVTITYEGKSDFFEVTVVAEEILPEIHYIEITREPDKTVYHKGETFDPSGIVVTCHYKDGTFEEVTNYDISGYDTNCLGTQTVTVTHRTHSATFQIEVISQPQVYMTQLTIDQQPSKIIYTRGEKFTAAGIVVTAHFNNGTYELVTDFDMSEPDMNRLGRQEIFVTYGGYEDSFVITILPPEGLPFVDVHTSDWFYDYVYWAYHNEVMVGVSNSRFDPNASTTRAMICMILYRLAGSPEEIVANPMPFSDVPDGKWYSDAITWCAGRGIVAGYGNGKFGPNDTITREQMSAMLYRYAQYAGIDVSAQAGLNGFNDYSQVDKYAITPMAWCVAKSIINGTGNNNLSPNKYATRAEVATMIFRFYELMNNPCCNS